jgi:hypothetical protein
MLCQYHGNFYWVDNPLNQKRSATENVYRETATGLVPYTEYRKNVITALSLIKVNTTTEQDKYVKLISRHHKIDEVNVDASHLIATPNGKVIDFDNLCKVINQGNRIINPLKKRRKAPAGKGWRGITDIRTELALIPAPRIDRCKKHHLADILLLCIISQVCGVASVEDIVFFGKTREWTLPHLVDK